MQSAYSKYLDIVNKWLGKYCDRDGQFGPMCVDWVKQYADEIGYPITTFGNANDYIVKGLGPNWERVNGEIWVADIGILPARKGMPYGHIFVVESVVGNTLNVIEQNRNGKASSTTKGTPISHGSYKLKGNEVFYRVY